MDVHDLEVNWDLFVLSAVWELYLFIVEETSQGTWQQYNHKRQQVSSELFSFLVYLKCSTKGNDEEKV